MSKFSFLLFFCIVCLSIVQFSHFPFNKSELGFTCEIQGDEIPPTIDNLLATPNKPSYNEQATVTATITDNADVDSALLSYSDGMDWQNVSMNNVSSTFTATIPGQAYGTVVQYRVYAVDTSGNWAESDIYMYTVGDSVPPEISSVEWKPACPFPYVSSNVTRPNEPTLVTANASDPAGGSRMFWVSISCRTDSDGYWIILMYYNATTGLWTATIPAQSNATDVIECTVRASDWAGNVAAYPTQSLHVQPLLAGDINGDGRIDMWDIGYIARHFMEHYP